MVSSPPAVPVRVLLVDDHALFRLGLRSLLQSETELAIVGEAANGSEGIELARQLQPDVVLLDLNMPDLSGAQCLGELRAVSPHSAVLMLTVSEEAQDLAAAMQAGACGYLVKSIDRQALVRAILSAGAGDLVVSESMGAKLAERMRDHAPAASAAAIERLTAREREILACLARGESNKVIARQFALSESTVKSHVQNVLKKLNLNSRVQAAVVAVEQRLFN